MVVEEKYKRPLKVQPSGLKRPSAGFHRFLKAQGVTFLVTKAGVKELHLKTQREDR